MTTEAGREAAPVPAGLGQISDTQTMARRFLTGVSAGDVLMPFVRPPSSDEVTVFMPDPRGVFPRYVSGGAHWTVRAVDGGGMDVELSYEAMGNKGPNPYERFIDVVRLDAHGQQPGATLTSYHSAMHVERDGRGNITSTELCRAQLDEPEPLPADYCNELLINLTTLDMQGRGARSALREHGRRSGRGGQLPRWLAALIRGRIS